MAAWQAHALLMSLLALPCQASLSTWMPDSATIYKDLTYKGTPQFNSQFAGLVDFKGMGFSWKPSNWSSHWFDASFWPVWTAENWQIPLVAVALYIVAIPSLKYLVAAHGKWDVRNFAFYWNASLSIFSWCGVFACMPVLVSSILEHGLYFTTCATPAWYYGGHCGFFVALFIYSKVFELIDTVLLILAGKEVMMLQWWHHSTVLLYCWHSYSSFIATGLWFAAMNYSVHSVMYGYFSLTSTRYRKYVTPYAMFITLAQLAQMVMGIFVTVTAVRYQEAGLECHVNKTNSVLGLAMYFSYFVLFLKLFVDNYVTRSRKKPPAATEQAKSKSESEKKGKKLE